ncbi:NADPH-dependent FMN reductase [Halovivax gelatinilyticus]|uniref:NADPH-dependent FMN reductase n=1 Tax=Halovivax gelatinilyticus TaxID=2961597 RepID=UPI0020CA4240|nr:NAD(P)H-dependent oxidoreductase [Halovivax gelatinilyticus]
MTSGPSILAVSGSLRDESYTRTALKYVLAAAADAGAETDLLDLREYDLPLYDPDVDEQGDETEVRRRVRDADALVLGTPVYHGSYSGALKNFHDYCGKDDYEHTTVGLLATAGGGSFGPTLDHLRSTVRGVHGWVVPNQVGIRNARNQFVDDPNAIDGRAVRDSSLEDRFERLGETLVAYAYIDPTQVAESASAADD